AVDPGLAGIRTSLFLDPDPGGLVGVIRTMARLREECPWDRRQTHESLVKNLIEETYELVEAIGSGSDGAMEDELGDVLLQVLFHANIARQDGAFDIEDVAEALRQKLVRRHPHVFGEVEVETAEQVKANWEQIKRNEQAQRDEKGARGGSILDEIPRGLPALERAARIQRRAAEIGFDWPEVSPVLDKVLEETEEVRTVLADRAAVGDEIGDLLFSVVNLARHLEVEPELALRRAIQRFTIRFRSMEAAGPLEGLSLDEMDRLWESAKQRGRREPEGRSR
ncbi:MAG TPA: nucleoside triphosphate pyrophosphohydrolase, partial [Acidimicrobiia bacterium]|nr:nucleoside triphosphate pyrophosphohydrolase [Acidimicrobiia bacterium]